MGGGFTKALQWLPVAVVAAGVIASGAVDNFRIQAHADELLDLSESIDENELDIEEIQRLLIQRQGAVALDIQRIDAELKNQGNDLDEILRIIRALNSNN